MEDPSSGSSGTFSRWEKDNLALRGDLQVRPGLPRFSLSVTNFPCTIPGRPMYLLQRHRMPINAWFESSLVLAYALPANVLQPMLPPGLVLDTYKNHGFLAIVLVHTRGLRPAFVPRGLGISFFLSGYRVFARYKTQAGEVLRGLKVLRTDTNHWAMRIFGNILTRYNYKPSSWNVSRSSRGYTIEIRTSDGKADLQLEADLSSRPVLPAGSPFDDLKDAERFAGPLPFTFDYERETNSIIRVEGVREHWNPRPVSVKVHRSRFLEQDAFRGAGPILANAFYVENVPYGWLRGIRESVP